MKAAILMKNVMFLVMVNSRLFGGAALLCRMTEERRIEDMQNLLVHILK